MKQFYQLQGLDIHAVPERRADGGLGGELLADALEDEHVGVNGHTEREDNTADTRHCQHGLEGGQDAECEEEVEDEAEVGDEAGDEAVEGAHENHEQHDSA